MGDEVRACVEALSGAKAGTSAFLGKYQQGLQEVMDGMDNDGLRTMELRREQWEQDHHPPEVQRR